MSLRGRSYSDPSYGSEKVLYSQLWSAGTRATGLVENIATPMTPIEVVDFNVLNTVVGTGGPSTWVLAATSGLGTHAIATFALTGTHAANIHVNGSVTTTGTTHLVGAEGNLNLYSVLSTASPAPIIRFDVAYQEHYTADDN